MKMRSRGAVAAVACLTLPLWALAAGKAPAPGREKTALGGRSRDCVACHQDQSPGIVEQWRASAHARRGVGCWECHRAEKGDADAFDHGGTLVATIVSPRDCGRCHRQENGEFQPSHHARAGNILASLDNYLAEVVEGARQPFAPQAGQGAVNGLASAQQGCMQCHGSKVALAARDGGRITVDDLKPGPDGKPTSAAAMERIARGADGRPILAAGTWPNTGIGRLNLDGSLGSCTACHSRHDFSARRARRPESCGKCHLGPDHPQKEIYEESKHGIAYRDLEGVMNLGAESWVLGKTYSQAPTCASCHVSANVNGGTVTHDIGERISWTNRPVVSLPMDTDAEHRVVTEADPGKRKALVADSAARKRERMKQACLVCHGPAWVDGFYEGYDQLVRLYNEKFARPGLKLMNLLYARKLVAGGQFRDQIEWDWYYLWHHQGRRARHGASMMAPDYAHWHGMFEVAEAFYTKVVPEARQIARRAAAEGRKDDAAAVDALLDEILSRPEHAWFQGEQAKRAARP